jgi:exosortase A-associated hydrolase 1
MGLAVSHDERPLVFECEGESLVGILCGALSAAPRGVLIVVGGPQYRVGSHRQFTLLARHLADRGVATLRFDYRGMGDSDGAPRTFERVGADIRCAIDRFFADVPGLKDVVIWGLCDAASAALFYAHQDARVSGLVLLNPWVRTEQGIARAQLRHYYVLRLFQASFWTKLARGEFRFREAAGALRRAVGDALRRRRPSNASAASLPERMEEGLRQFRGPALFILSGNDLTAQEFKDAVARSPGWKGLLGSERVNRRDLVDANHTFARRDWRDEVARLTEAWIRSF